MRAKEQDNTGATCASGHQSSNSLTNAWLKYLYYVQTSFLKGKVSPVCDVQIITERKRKTYLHIKRKG